MKTKVYVELLPKSEKNIVAEVVLEKANHDNIRTLPYLIVLFTIILLIVFSFFA